MSSLTFDKLLSRATGLTVVLMHVGGILLVHMERLMGVALIPVDTSRTLNCMAMKMSKHGKIKLVSAYGSILRSRLGQIIFTPLPCVKS